METKTWSCSGSDELKLRIREVILKKEKKVSDYKPDSNVFPILGQELCFDNFLTQMGLTGKVSQ